MKFFLNNNKDAQEALFKHGFRWYNTSTNVSHINHKFVCFYTEDEHNLGGKITYGDDENWLLFDGYLHISIGDIGSAVNGTYTLPIEVVVHNLPKGITKVTYNGIEYELRTVTEQKWVKV